MKSEPSFTAYESTILRAFATALIPAVPGMRSHGGNVDFIPYLERFLMGGETRLSRLGVRACLWSLEFSPACMSVPGIRFSLQDPRLRQKVLRQWEHSHLYFRRAVFLVLKTVVGMAYCSVPAVAREMGYDPTCHRGDPS